MAGSTIVKVVLAILLAGTAQAQIDQNSVECSRIWGDPVSGALDTNGVGTLVFKSEEGSVEIGFLADMAQRVVYRLSDTDEEAIGRLLSMNSQGTKWDAWSPPGQSPMGKTRQWMRADEMAMAQLTPEGLTVVGAQWNQHRAAPRPTATAVESAAEPAAEPLTKPGPGSGETLQTPPLPEPKPKQPSNLPARGDSREAAITLLGPPNGTMRSGRREALVYPWGNIWLEDGKVLTSD